MPSGVYKRNPMSKLTKQKIGLANLGKPNGKKGKKLSTETRLKISSSKKGTVIPRYVIEKARLTNLGRKQSIEEITRRVTKNTGKKRSQYTKDKMSLAHKDKKKPWVTGHPGLKGSASPNWKGGVVSQNKLIRSGANFKIWRELVYQRDNWTCQKCLKIGSDLNPHHIMNFSNNIKIRFDVNNGITFCRTCHYQFHKNYGFNNNNYSQVMNFLSIKI